VIVVAIIGILAYQDYTAKAQASEAFIMMDGIKTTIADSMSQDAAVPANVACVCTATFTMNAAGVNGAIASTTVIMTYDSATGLFNTSQAATVGTMATKYGSM
jgi:type IV pilus assembly protein PilA